MANTLNPRINNFHNSLMQAMDPVGFGDIPTMTQQEYEAAVAQNANSPRQLLNVTEGTPVPDYSKARETPWWENVLNYYVRPFSDWLSLGLGEIGWQKWDKQRQSERDRIAEILATAQDDPTAAQGMLAAEGLNVNPDVEKWLDNLIAQQNTEDAQDFAREQSQTDLLNAASQLEQLGLSSSGVLQTGGSSTNAVSAAANSKENIGMQQYAQRMAIAKQLLGMTSQMASAGVYGHAFGAAKKAAGIVTSAASHSAIQSIQQKYNIKDMSPEEMVRIAKTNAYR